MTQSNDFKVIIIRILIFNYILSPLKPVIMDLRGDFILSYTGIILFKIVFSIIRYGTWE